MRLVGLTSATTEQLIRNQLRSKPGQPFLTDLVREDIQRFTRTGRVREIEARVQPLADQSVILTYEFTEARLISDVRVVGNRQISDQELFAALPVLQNTPVDEYELGRAIARIQELYRKKGYYLAEVSVDQDELEKTGTVIFNIRERERVKVTDIRFRGNRAFAPAQLFPVIRTKIAGLFETGPLDDEVLDQDVAAVIKYYRDHGYLDVRADREVRPSPNAREAIVTFIIDEGPLYTLRSVQAELNDGAGRPSGRPPGVFTVEQLTGIMLIKPGDAYSVDKLDKSIAAVQDAYGTLGYVDATVERAERRDPERPEVDLVLIITEGKAYKTGLVTVKGNDITQTKVVLRQVRVKPGRPLDTVELRESQQALEQIRLFERSPYPGGPSSVKLTIQPPEDAESENRDVLVEVKETNTGSLTFGVGINSDAGLGGAVSLQQRNFDLFDLPESFEEFITGRAFRGAGQTFNLTLAPGTEVQEYSILLADPYLFETDYSGSAAAAYRIRKYSQYDEDRATGQLAVGRRFGDRWSITVAPRISRVELSDIDADAPIDVFEVADPHVLTALGVRVQRTTYNRAVRPTRGTRLDFGVEQAGALGGDFDFTRLEAGYSLYLPVYESFLGRTTVLSFKSTAGYIPQDEDAVPVYERFYLGGRSFRGFRFRTISPKGIRADTLTQGDDPVGGTWSFFFGAELEQPLWEDILSGVVFVDTGTVTNDPGFDQYRVSVGVGLRISVPLLGPMPLAFDFGFPILKEDLDDTRLFSFSIDVPF